MMRKMRGTWKFFGLRGGGERGGKVQSTPPCQQLTIADKIQIPGRRGLIGNGSSYYGPSLLWTPIDIPRVSATMRADCIWKFVHTSGKIQAMPLYLPMELSICKDWSRPLSINKKLMSLTNKFSFKFFFIFAFFLICIVIPPKLHKKGIRKLH